MSDSTEQDVAALVARLEVQASGFAYPDSRHPKIMREAAAALLASEARATENAKEALAAQGQADDNYQRWVASEARATALEGERDGFKRALVREKEHATALETQLAWVGEALAGLLAIAEDEGIVGDDTSLEAAREALLTAQGAILLSAQEQADG